jgi:hypothetical protein
VAIAEIEVGGLWRLRLVGEKRKQREELKEECRI